MDDARTFRRRNWVTLSVLLLTPSARVCVQPLEDVHEVVAIDSC